jgi:O-antigen/teichoic acid export membrane protein
MVLWLNLLDIGFGNGVKNKIAEAKVRGDMESIRKYVSSTYAMVGGICLIVFILFCLINPHLNWSKILGSVPSQYSEEIAGVVWIFMAAFCFTFVLNLLKFIVTADQRPAVGSFLDMLGQLLTMAGIFILSKTTPPSLISLGLVTGFAPVIVLIIASLILFHGRYRDWRPAWKYIDLKSAGNMMNLGIQFFIATIAAFMVTSTLPFFIQRFTNPVEVTNYNTAFRLFSVAFNVLNIIILPYWSSFTDAYTQQDFTWMKKSIAQLHRFFIYLLIAQCLLLTLSPVIYYVWVNYWIKDTVNLLDIPFRMSLSVCIYVCTLCWLNMHIYPINGIGKVKLQVISSIGEMVTLIPVAWVLGHAMGATGIILAPVVVYLPRMIWSPLQLNKLINRTAKGIWAK